MAPRPNTLNVDDVALKDLLGEMGGQPIEETRRQFARWPFPRATVGVEINQPGGTRNMLRLACRNLSRQGISLLHAGYLHTDVRCVVHLPRAMDGVARGIPGTLVRCAHRAGHVHELGIKFDGPIDLHEFLEDQTTGSSFEFVSPDMLKGRVLIAEENAFESSLVKHMLRETGLTSRCANDLASLLAKARDGADVAIVSMTLPPDQGPAAVRAIRSAGHTFPIIMLVRGTLASLGPSRQEIGADLVMRRPENQQQLLCMLAEALLVRRTPRTNATRSPVAAGARNVQAALENRDAEALHEACLGLREAAPRSGFATLASLADAVAKQVKLAGQIEAVMGVVRELLDECERVTRQA